MLEWRPELVEPGQMGERVADGDTVFPGSGEFGPVRGDRIVDRQHTPVVEEQHDERRHRLGRAPQIDDRVGLPRSRSVDRRRSTPDVTDETSTVHDRSTCAEFRILVEVGGERRPHRFEPLVGVAADPGCHRPPPHPGERRRS
ncbi:MAG: hypothetical protein EBY52_04195 [Actinobacteria bacterium]|nr:hypothetical protein [Actinomycetota bacterium]